jgi:surface protein
MKDTNSLKPRNTTKLLFFCLALTLIGCSSGDDPGTDNADTTPPLITLIGSASVSVIQGGNYVDEGATAVDDVDGDLTSSITVTGNVDTAVIGNYTLTYSVSDTAGNSASAARNVNVTPPSGCENGEVVYLDSNGVTVKACPGAQIGESGALNGVTYTIVDDATLRTMAWNGEDVTTVCTSRVTDMELLFSFRESFNQDIGHWDVSNVTSMRQMFSNALAFNQDIRYWDVSNVTDMSFMFSYAYSFDQPIGNWDVSSVSTMVGMFGVTIPNENLTYAFNQPIGEWDVSNVTLMMGMFSYTDSFNQPIGDWDVSNVTQMDEMFKGATAFDQDIGNWDVSNVIGMNEMFFGATSINQDLSNWNVTNVFFCSNFSALAPQWILPKPNFLYCTP